MTSINVTVCGAQARAEKTGKLTTYMVGVPVSFSFDGAWEGLNKFAVFRSGGQVRDRALILNNTTTVPHEVLHRKNERLEIGVEGRAPDGTLVIPTTWADAGVVLDGANASGVRGKDPTPDAYDDIMAAIKSGALRGPQGEKGDTPLRDISTGKLTEVEKAAFAKLDGQEWLESDLIKESNSLPGFAAWAYRHAGVDAYEYFRSVHQTFAKMFDTSNKAANGYKYKMLAETEDNRRYLTMLLPGSYGGGTAMTSHGYEFTMTRENIRVGDIGCCRYTKKLDDGSSTDKCYYMAICIADDRFLVYADYGPGVPERMVTGYCTWNDIENFCSSGGKENETAIYYFFLRPENLAIEDVLQLEKELGEEVRDLAKTVEDRKDLTYAYTRYKGHLPISRGGTGAENAKLARENLRAMPDYLVNYDITVTQTSKTLDEQIDDILWEIFDKNRGNAAAVNAFVSVVCEQGVGKEKFSLKAGGNRWMMLITKITSNYARVLAWCTGSFWMRTKLKVDPDDENWVWEDWTQENPPMHYGVEYCTTERYKGKPVYTKLVNCGGMATDFKTVKHGLPAGFTPVRSSCTMGKYNLPVGLDLPDRSAYYYAILSEYIALNAAAATYKNLPVAVQIWYTK